MWLQALTWTSVVDVILVALSLWVWLTLMRTAKSALALSLVGGLGIAYVAAKSVGLVLTAWILLLLLGVAALFIVILCQDDVRTWLNRVAARLFERRAVAVRKAVHDTIVEALHILCEQHTGALVVVPGKQSVEPEVHGGIELDAKLSIPLLLSLFDAKTPGHDGALVIQGDRALRFAVHLPLSTREDLLQGRGTRHAAALGLSERTDALCIAVSEEHGDISVAFQGAIQTVDAPGLRAALLRHASGERPSKAHHGEKIPWHVHAGRGALALVLACLAWIVAVPGSEVTTRVYHVPVIVENLPDGLEVESVGPEWVTVEVSGPQRQLLLTTEHDIRPAVDATDAAPGQQSFVLLRSSVETPRELEVKRVRPQRVEVRLRADAS